MDCSWQRPAPRNLPPVTGNGLCATRVRPGDVTSPAPREAPKFLSPHSAPKATQNRHTRDQQIHLATTRSHTTTAVMDQVYALSTPRTPALSD